MKGQIMNEQIITSQIGFFPEDKKKAVIRGGQPSKFQVVNVKNNCVVYQGDLSSPIENIAAGEHNYIADFSELIEEGTYVIKVKDLEDSYPFVIGINIYNELIESASHFFYLQRCGCHIPKLYGNDYAHLLCHHTPARIYGTDRFMNVNGGWHDAGDYGRYIVAAAVTVADLLLSYEASPELMGKELAIPELDYAMPDLLVEIKYELDWMLKMQDVKTGKVYHKVTCSSFPGFVMPELETEELVISPASVTATATFAAVMAMAMRFYINYDGEFARTCIRASVAAYDAMKGMFMPGGFRNPNGVVTGEYGDSNDVDERYWAAAELYKTTGDEVYRKDFEQYAKTEILHGYGWEDVGSYGNLAYITTKFEIDEALVTQIKKTMLTLADNYLTLSSKDSYGVGLSITDYIWGSNMLVAGIGNHLYDGYRITGETKYLDAAKEQLHYLLGKNPTGYCYVTGFGSKSPANPHHRPSAAINKPMAGMLVGGPDSGLHDPDALAMLEKEPPAKCYIDVLGSYSTNEITIYWNSALLYLMAVVC